VEIAIKADTSKVRESLTHRLTDPSGWSSSNLNCSHKSYYMTSSASSSNPTISSSTSSSTSTNLSSSLSQYNFDPFAVHPFTSYVSSNPNSNAPAANSYAYPFRQPLGDHLTHAPIPNQQSPPKPYVFTAPHHTGIFVPFRKETSSPDLAILKPKSDSSSVTPATTSKSRPT